MKDIANKADNVPAPAGVLPADDWNDRNTELENAVVGSGQALTNLDDDQLLRAIGLQGSRVTISAGTAEPGQTVIVDNTGGPVTINLPATPATNTLVHFEQLPNSLFSSNILTVGRNGQTIMGFSQDMTVGNITNDDNVKFTMRFDGTTWRILLTGEVA